MKEEMLFKNEEGLTLTIITEDGEGCHSLMGGDDSNPTWEEYKSVYKEEYWPHLELIKKAIKELHWIGKTGEDISNYYAFKFSDGVCWGYSWRAWGDLMQAIVGKKEGYMKYYM